jgi:SAM-dependent methyltransferase
MDSPRTENAPTPSCPWFEDEHFWESIYPFTFSEDRFISADAEVGEFTKLTGKPFARVLDLGCGPGRHSIPLAKQGAQVTGVDRSPFLLEKARSRAEFEKLNIEWVQADMRSFIRPGEFDLVINLFTSFGYFGDVEEDLTVLRNVFRSLAPGGFFIIDVMGKKSSLADLRPAKSASSQTEAFGYRPAKSFMIGTGSARTGF